MVIVRTYIEYNFTIIILHFNNTNREMRELYRITINRHFIVIALNMHYSIQSAFSISTCFLYSTTNKYYNIESEKYFFYRTVFRLLYWFETLN